MKTELELKNGTRRKFTPQLAKVLIARGMGKAVIGPGYLTRDMQADRPVADISSSHESAAEGHADTDEAPYGRKADGTPRKRPGRNPVSE